MNIYDVYTLFDVHPVKGQGCHITDDQGQEYLDFYGGHAVMSIGHAHPHWVKRIQDQVAQLAFYSNSVQNHLQNQLAKKIVDLSGMTGYELFFCNSGAEANENALKLAAMQTGRSRLLCFDDGFHGRTTAAVSVTANQNIKSSLDSRMDVSRISFEDFIGLKELLETRNFAAVIIEAIQGIGGLNSPSVQFFKEIGRLCIETDTLLIADEVQCGFARTGKFFGFQHYGVQPDIISMAKGMGNGFPIGGILINAHKMPARKGMLGSTFGGNHLACVACLAVLEVIEKESLLDNASTVGQYLEQKLRSLPGAKEVKGKGLMCGVSFDFPIKVLRTNLVYEHYLFTGSSANPNQLRILPPLNINTDAVDDFISRLEQALSNQKSMIHV